MASTPIVVENPDVQMNGKPPAGKALKFISIQRNNIQEMELMIDGSGPEAQLEFDCTSVNRTFDLIVREGTKTMFEGKTFISSTPRRFSEIIIIPLAYSGPIDKISAARNQT